MQQKHEYPFLRLEGEFVAVYSIMVKFRKAFRESPGLAVFVKLLFPALGNF
jgi:hypothetical protein